jgi:hypothetical protein
MYRKDRKFNAPQEVSPRFSPHVKRELRPDILLAQADPPPFGHESSRDKPYPCFVLPYQATRWSNS